MKQIGSQILKPPSVYSNITHVSNTRHVHTQGRRSSRVVHTVLRRGFALQCFHYLFCRQSPRAVCFRYSEGIAQFYANRISFFRFSTRGFFKTFQSKVISSTSTAIAVTFITLFRHGFRRNAGTQLPYFV